MSSGAGRLAEILTHKTTEVAAAQQAWPLAQVRAAAQTAPPVRHFAAALAQRARSQPPAVIAEIKFASPSAGVISAAGASAAGTTAAGTTAADTTAAGADRASALAASYAAGGAACLSVLTDSRFFAGSFDYLSAVRANCELPVLCKDFIVDPWQIWRARAAGADAVLLIVAALNADERLRALAAEAKRAQMTILVEVHSLAELKRALAEPALNDPLNPSIIGINNRNLATLATSLETSEQLLPLAPPERLKVSESGLRTGADLVRLRRAGAQAFLIGESLMRQADPGAALAELLASARNL